MTLNFWIRGMSSRLSSNGFAVFSVLMIFVFLPCKAQVSGKIVDTNQEPLPFMNVLLLRATDSLMVKGTLSDEAGFFIFNDIPNGEYIINANMLSYENWFSSKFELNLTTKEKYFDTIVLQEETMALNEVQVTATKRLIQQIPEGTVLNVQSSVLTKGSNALELLQRSPGVLLDERNNDFSLNGKGGVNVMINGKALRIPVSEIMNFLKGIRGDNIERIELLTNPSSKYDADGSAGIINIVLKKNQNVGTNGSFTNNTGIGFGPKQVNTFTINSNTEKSTLYGTISLSYDQTVRAFEADANNSIPVLGGNTDIFFASQIETINRGFNLNTGYSLSVGSKSELGMEFQYNFSRPDMVRRNLGSYSFANGNFLAADITVDGGNEWDNLIGGVYFENVLDDASSYSLSLDYINYKSNSPTLVVSEFTDASGQQIFPEGEIYNEGSRGISDTNIDVGVAKGDYSKTWGTFKFETGGKYTISFTRNNGRSEFIQNDEFTTDERFNANSTIDEKIAALYTSLDVSLDSTLKVSAGLRYEYWQRDFDIDSLSNSTQRIFPSIFLNKRLSDNSNLNFAYNRRVTRPTFNDLASFLIYNDPTSVFAGNPLLQPALVDNLSLAYNYGKYNFSIGYSHEKNPIARFQISENEMSDLVVISSQNLDYQKQISLQATIPIRVHNWCNVNLNATSGWREFKISHTPISVVNDYLYTTVNASLIFNLPSQLTLEFSGWYNSKSFNGSVEVEGYGSLNAGIKKEFRDNSSMQFSITDIFTSINVINNYGALTPEAYGNTGRVHFRPESTINPIFRLSYTKSFGSNRLGNRKVKSGAEDERSRINQ